MPRLATLAAAAASAAVAAAALAVGATLLRRRRRRERVRLLPKIEFHAHLHGSIRRSTLRALADERGLGAKARAVLGGPRDLPTCFAIFGLVHACVDSLDVVARVCEETLEDFAAEGCAYVELRSTPRALGGATVAAYVERVAAAMESWDDAKLTPRFLVSVDRSRGSDAARATVDAVLRLRETSPIVRKYVVGVDFSGNPTSSDGFGSYEALFRRCRAAGLGLALHCGEVAREDDDGARILAIAAEDPARCRLGHALHFRDDDLADARSLVEVCPSSNACTLGLASLADHPRLKAALRGARGPPISLCTDDTAVFDTNLTDEWLKVMDAFGCDLADLAYAQADAATFAFDRAACTAALQRSG